MTEKGYTKIPNKLLDAFYIYDFTDRQRRMMLFIFRFTIGCRRQWVRIDKSDFKMAGIYKSDIVKELDNLAKLNTIQWKASENLICLNLEISAWNMRPNKLYKPEHFDKLLHRSIAKHPPTNTYSTNNRGGSLPTRGYQKANYDNASTESKQSLNKERKDVNNLIEKMHKKMQFPEGSYG